MMNLLSKLNRISNNVKSQLKIYYKTKWSFCLKWKKAKRIKIRGSANKESKDTALIR